MEDAQEKAMSELRRTRWSCAGREDKSFREQNSVAPSGEPSTFQKVKTRGKVERARNVSGRETALLVEGPPIIYSYLQATITTVKLSAGE